MEAIAVCFIIRNIIWYKFDRENADSFPKDDTKYYLIYPDKNIDITKAFFEKSSSACSPCFWVDGTVTPVYPYYWANMDISTP